MTAIEIVRAKGWTVSDLSYREADRQAHANRCCYLYDAGNGNVGLASWREAFGKVVHQVTTDGRIWF